MSPPNRSFAKRAGALDWPRAGLSARHPALVRADHELRSALLTSRKLSLSGIVLPSRLRAASVHAPPTASAQGWKISVAPLLLAPSRSTALGQANFIGRVCTRASS